VVAAVRWLGDEATSRIARHDRYAVPFAAVEFDPPPGTDPDTFRAEVRYAGQPPDPVHPLDPADRGRLAAAFAAHPWVEAAEVVADPPAAVRVRLRFRTPVLAVRQTDGPVRLVDGEGVLLPAAPAPAGVAELTTPVSPPAAAAGRVWDDETVRRAVELVKAYRPAKLEKGPKGWRLTLPDGKVLAVG
jgi:cell division septal protein FtsQ